MLSILNREFMDVLKSFKSIAVVIFFTLISTLTARFFSNNPGLLADEDIGAVYTSSIKLLVFFIGFLFVFSISHNLINRELDLNTIRLLATKVSRFKILIGKFLGVSLFWLFSLTISFILVSLYANQWFWIDFFIVIIFMLFVISFVTFLSIVVEKPGLTMFLGILLGLSLPILGLYSIFTDTWYLLPFRFSLPYYYIMKSGWFLLIPLCKTAILLYFGNLILNRKDL